MSDDVLDDLKRYYKDAMRAQDVGRQYVYGRAVDEIEQLRSILSELVKYGDDHDWGFMPVGKTIERARSHGQQSR